MDAGLKRHDQRDRPVGEQPRLAVAHREEVERVEARQVLGRGIGEAPFAAQHVRDQCAARLLGGIRHRAANIGHDHGAAAGAMDPEPCPAGMQVAAGDDPAAVVPFGERRGGARVKLVAVADEDEGPVGMGLVSKGDDAHASAYRDSSPACQAS